MCVEKEIWSGNKIRLVDTSFWTSLSKEPTKFNDKYRKRENILEYDFVVMPMHES
jgi:hypothetical protein